MAAFGGVKNNSELFFSKKVGLQIYNEGQRLHIDAGSSIEVSPHAFEKLVCFQTL